jgi:hypothetical protein
MLLVNSSRLLVAEALQDEKHPMHVYAKEYDQELKALRKKYPEGSIRLLRVGYPKFSDSYINARNIEVSGVPEDIPPMRFSLRASVSHPQRGKELWEVCLDTPKALPGGLWELGKIRSKQISAGLTVDLIKEADLAYFLYYKCPHVKSGQWKVEDPKADLKARADKEIELLDVNIAIWKTLQDENLLKKMASSFGLEVKGKDPNQLRFELKDALVRNDDAQKRDPAVRGTKELMEDLKITDYIRLCTFVRYWIDESKIVWSKDGRYKVGDKTIAHVPAEQVRRKFDWFCNYLSAPNSVEDLKSLMLDLVNKEYLDSITDEKDYRWLAKAMDIQGFYNQTIDKVKELVYATFNVA